MAFVLSEPMKWHQGEEQMHKLFRVPPRDNPASPFLSPGAASMLAQSPLLALGTLDDRARPWTTVIGGDVGFTRQVAPNTIGINTAADSLHDPVMKALLGQEATGTIVKSEGRGPIIAGLGIRLEDRRRIKIAGRMIAGLLDEPKKQAEEGYKNLQLVLKIDESMGNCPKYLNAKYIKAADSVPQILASSLPLSTKTIQLIDNADLFFISSSNHDNDMDTNHRGGPPGFVRVLSNDSQEAVLVYPEYSGNRMYQTLGNLMTTPKAGLCFPDFETGDILYVTGETTVLAGSDAANLLPRSNLAVKIKVTDYLLVKQGLFFRGDAFSPSPYNPKVRYLRSEKPLDTLDNGEAGLTGTLVDKKQITPTISRYTFESSSPLKWKAGQYVALGFEHELSAGYSHMRDDDPLSINDDYVRTFTVSSIPHKKKFDITIRHVGKATNFLSKQAIRSALQLPIQGFAGEFFIKQDPGEEVAFVAGGIGVTPLLSQVPAVDLLHFRLYWALNKVDMDLLADTVEQYPELASRTTLFISGLQQAMMPSVFERIGRVEQRRIQEADVEDIKGVRWYVCAGPSMSKAVMEWLAGEEVHSESFNY